MPYMLKEYKELPGNSFWHIPISLFHPPPLPPQTNTALDQTNSSLLSARRWLGNLTQRLGALESQLARNLAALSAARGLTDEAENASAAVDLVSCISAFLTKIMINRSIKNTFRCQNVRFSQAIYSVHALCLQKNKHPPIFTSVHCRHTAYIFFLETELPRVGGKFCSTPQCHGREGEDVARAAARGGELPREDRSPHREN